VRMPQRDPIRAYQREATAARRIGAGAQCLCGEARPKALKPSAIICAACARRNRGESIMDKHHIAGKANDPATVSVPVNDHRAELSTAQYDWPRETLENPTRSPLLRGAGCIRGVTNLFDYLSWIAEMLERLDYFLTRILGPNWWHKTE